MPFQIPTPKRGGTLSQLLEFDPMDLVGPMAFGGLVKRGVKKVVDVLPPFPRNYNPAVYSPGIGENDLKAKIREFLRAPIYDNRSANQINLADILGFLDDVAGGQANKLRKWARSQIDPDRFSGASRVDTTPSAEMLLDEQELSERLINKVFSKMGK